MPELPEVEVIRLGLVQGLLGATVSGVEVRDARSLRRHRTDGLDPVADFERRMTGAVFGQPARRGKFLWIPLHSSSRTTLSEALLGHLGMSGQLLLRTADQPDDKHVRVRLWIEHPDHGELRLDFADQRIFGSLAIDSLSRVSDGNTEGQAPQQQDIPSQVLHIARDPLDPAFDDATFLRVLHAKTAAIKRVILDQRVVSGIGNIYADEALWIARIHPETPARELSAIKRRRLLQAVRDVFNKALAEGGTSFDALYVNVNGESGYFAHSLNAYGRGGEPCPRCGVAIVRESFMNRGSHFCPRCQRRR